MKDINFMTPVPEFRKKELRRWCILSITLITSIIIGLVTVTIMQIRLHSSLSRDKDSMQAQLTQFDAIMENNRAQKEKETSIKTKLTALNACATCAQNPLNLLSTIRKALGNMHLQSLKISENTLELEALCKHPKQATELVENLSHTKQCKQTSLVSLHTFRNDQLICTLKANL